MQLLHILSKTRIYRNIQANLIRNDIGIIEHIQLGGGENISFFPLVRNFKKSRNYVVILLY